MKRELRYIDIEQIEEDIAAGKVEDDGESAEYVLYETLLDLLQISEEGMTVDEVDSVLRRIMDYRAGQRRSRFRLHTGDAD